MKKKKKKKNSERFKALVKINEIQNSCKYFILSTGIFKLTKKYGKREKRDNVSKLLRKDLIWMKKNNYTKKLNNKLRRREKPKNVLYKGILY